MRLQLIGNNRILKVVQATQEEIKILNQILTVTWIEFKGKNKKIKSKCYFNDNKFIPSGFIFKIMELRKKGWTVIIDGLTNFIRADVKFEDVCSWVDEIKFKADYIVPRWYQYQALYKALKFNTSRGEYATGAGKTFICWLVAKYFLDEIIPKGGKILMVVPSVDLVKQTAKEWLSEIQSDDSIKIKFVSEGFVHEMEDSNLILGNIDTLINQPKEFYSDVRGIIFDEAHKLQTTQYKQIFDYVKFNKLDVVYGVSGTFYKKNEKHLEYEAMAICGSILMEVEAWELMEEGTLTPIEIYEILFKHGYNTCANFYGDKKVDLLSQKRNHYELDFIRKLTHRSKFICDWISKIDQNQLVLFKAKELLYTFQKYLLENCKDKQILVIEGDVKSKEREVIKKITEESDNVVILATYGTMSTGISIKNLHTLHLVEPPKSFIWLRQSIGRMVRKHISKDIAKIIGYVDVFNRYEKNWYGKGIFKNIVHGHLDHRIKVYTQQKFPYKIKEIDI